VAEDAEAVAKAQRLLDSVHSVEVGTAPVWLRDFSGNRAVISAFLTGADSHGAGSMQRRRFKNVLSFPDRLANEAGRLRKEAEALVHGPERDALLKKARQADIASDMEKWLSSPGLQPPT
jgi:hypothetical protein